MTVKANPERTRRVTYNDKASLVLTILIQIYDGLLDFETCPMTRL